MSTYVIKEVNNINADSKPIITVNGHLSSAKRRASSTQLFNGTILKIENTRGALIAYKVGGKWFGGEWFDA